MVNSFLKGKTIFLRPLEESDIEGPYKNWLNSQEATAFSSHGRFPVSVSQLLEYIKNAAKSNNALVFAVISSETNRHIGNISLQAINWIDRSAEIAFLMGEKEFQGKGIMYEAGELLIDHAFNTLNLHRVYCGTSSENIGMQKLAEKLKMNKEGVRKEALFKNGKYNDIIEYGRINTQI